MEIGPGLRILSCLLCEEPSDGRDWDEIPDASCD